jgi:flagellar biosynthesis/type III secretory pathway protein FliH
MLTPKDILDISEPIERIYQQTTDELLINIAHHFNISGWERTRYWEIKKLSEMGQLTKESAAIIAKNTQLLPEEIEKAFLQVSEKACKDIDPQLKEAAAKGILQGVETDATTSVLMRQLTQSYVDQAVDTMNMVNTTMLESTRQAYQRGIAIAVSDAALAEAGQALEVAAYQVVTGLETRTHAIRKAMNALASTGITGFYDKAGRRWSAEAYAAMDVRTTAHNAYVQGIKTRQQEFGGGDIFQVSAHPAARPLCYPYQGKFYSWSGSGTWTDGAGHKHEYKNISETSYGEPAGLFGINCGHHPIPMIDGFSYPQDYDIPTEAENAKEYEESQKQRAYEREIREAKRDLEIAKATGDEEAIKAAEQKVAQKQANMRAYTKETGRPRRYDREKIAGTKDIEGYRGYRAQFNSDIPLTGAAVPKTPEPKQYSTAMQRMVDGLKANGVKYKDVKKHAKALTESEIIEAIAGGVLTKGSCASVALAYVGQVNGLDVKDYRDGESRKYFALKYHLLNVFDMPNVNKITETARSEITAGNKLLQSVEEGKQYYFVAGQHAAIVTKDAEGLKYLELQHPDSNGWRKFNGNPRHTLHQRFGARNGRGIDETALMFDVTDMSGSDEFRELLGYINTSEQDQKKGKYGSIK